MPAAGQSGGVSAGAVPGHRRAADAEQLAKLTGRQVSTVSIHLAKLRNADVVRYDTSGRETRYWLKHPGETRGLLKALGKMIDRSVKVE